MRPHPGPRHVVATAASVLAALVLATVLGADAAAATPAAPIRYAPPVDAPVHDRFRPPPNPYAAGNRGIDFATTPGTAARSAAGGEVVFAGLVGGTRHVVVLHADGLRTSYSFLASVAVARGQVVGPGEVVGTTGATLHFGVRAGDRYLDPALLLGGAPVAVHLVPLEDRAPGPAEVERRWLVDALGTAAVAGSATAAWLVDQGAAVGSGALDLGADLAAAAVARGVPGPVLAVRAAEAARRTIAEVLADQAGCTPAAEPTPPPPGRRIVVLVAGYGSSGGDAEVLDLDTAALGYAPADRVQFSYAGGRVRGVGALAGVPVSGYGPADATGDLGAAGRRLRRLLDDIAAAHPGTPIDVVAHSQGGLVARHALGSGPPDAVAGAGDPPPVEHLVTLGTPHHGAALASVAGTLGLTDPTSPLGAGLAAATGGGVDPRADAVPQLAEGSAFLRDLARRPLPATVSVTSVAASGDLVVPAVASTLVGATNALVPLGGATAHARLPGSPEAARAIALALGGRAPACASTAAVVAGAVAAAAVGAGVRLAGQALAPGVAAADRGLARALPQGR